MGYKVSNGVKDAETELKKKFNEFGLSIDINETILIDTKKEIKETKKGVKKGNKEAKYEVVR